MASRKCRKCKHYKLQYSKVLQTYVEGCDVPVDVDRRDGCINTFEAKDKNPVAYIKRREEND